MSTTVLILSILITAATGIYLWLLLRQIKNLSGQLRFLENNRSRLRLTTDLQNPAVLELTRQINQHIEHSHELQIRLLQEESTTKEIITGLSHDIRTPLTSIDGYLQLLKTTEDPEKKEQYITIIQERTNSLARILEELFTFTKLQQEAFRLEPSEVNLNEAVAHNLFTFYQDFLQKGIRPDVRLEAEDPLVMADPQALERILQNILKNTLIHGAGDLQIQTAINSGAVALTVTNRLKPGSNIRPDELFDRFYKGDPTRQTSSTGLGLSIARRLAEKMDAELDATVEDERFSITLTFRSLKV